VVFQSSEVVSNLLTFAARSRLDISLSTFSRLSGPKRGRQIH
jgi:hypothetical protein